LGIPGLAHELIPLTKLLTVAEYSALGETAWGYTELIQGRVLMSPSPQPDHAVALGNVLTQLRDQVPAGAEALMNLDLDLQLAPADAPGSSRRPDLLVFDEGAGDRVSAEGGMLRAADVFVVIELVSADTKRIDHLHKRRDYADAGIPNYWIIDIDDPIALTACRLTEEFGYQDDQIATGIFTTEVPFPFEVNLDRLV
jgi:Uma2 family endonuclease